MPAPHLPVELVRDILQVLIDEHKWRDEPTTKLLALATVSKTWKPIVEELALRHVEVDIGGFKLAEDEVAVRSNSKASDDVSSSPQNASAAGDDEDFKASQRYTEGLIALRSLPRRTTDDASDSDEYQPVRECELERVQVRIYQEVWFLQEWRVRHALHCLIKLGSLRVFGLRFYKEASSTAVDEEGEDPETAKIERDAAQQLKATKVDLSYAFDWWDGIDRPGDVLFWTLIDSRALTELEFGNITRLPPFDGWTQCEMLEKLQIEYSAHENVVSTAASLLNILPELRQLRQLRLKCSELELNLMEDALLSAHLGSQVRRFPSPYSLSTFLEKLPRTTVLTILRHTHFEIPIDFPSISVSEESNSLRSVFDAQPQAFVSVAAPAGFSPAACVASLVLLGGADGQEKWTFLFK
ncbi:hypothetical protein C6P46_006982 [Rhodotorula mucilaginosa]|uniref:Uncharacterized protein n=1 Tax=Rhodotorula mucilaginosa TaxID=5537 RepID=A0A9P6VXR5_RHOMI|nr:hypothetical protein C6P46_006982 [Rhodotorula mucilaginosa]TKA52065.1 hypothetical protein B0A53_04725 [Rhodotorula sp. CCFEE 5036]